MTVVVGEPSPIPKPNARINPTARPPMIALTMLTTSGSRRRLAIPPEGTRLANSRLSRSSSGQPNAWERQKSERHRAIRAAMDELQAEGRESATATEILERVKSELPFSPTGVGLTLGKLGYESERRKRAKASPAYERYWLDAARVRRSRSALALVSLALLRLPRAAYESPPKPDGCARH